MGLFSFLEQEGQEQDAGPTLEQLGADPNSEAVKGKKLKVDDAALRRSIVSKEDEAVKLEQGAIRTVHQILKTQTGPGSLGGGDAQLVQVRDALDKGILKPHQLVDDLETILKKRRDPTVLRDDQIQALVSAVNDLKVSQQKRAEVQKEGSGLGPAPEIAPEVHAANAEEAFAKAQKLREEASNMGVLNRGNKMREAQNLEAQAQSLKSLSEEGQQPKEAQPAPQLPTPGVDKPVTHFMKSLGVDGLLPRVHAGLNKVGIDPKEWGDTNVDPSGGLMRVLAELDPEGKFAQMIVQQLSLARQQDLADSQGKGAKDQEDPRIGETRQAIQGKEAEMKALYAQLRETPFMRTWPGIILYVLVGLITQNPAFAARLIGGVGNRDAVNAEIKGIQFDLRRLDDELKWRERNDIETKREAARRLQRQDNEQDQRKWELSKMMIQHNLIIQRNAARGNPETFLVKKLANDFQRNLGMASKFQGTMQNEFADPKDRAKAKENWDYYMRKAAELHQQIQGMGGTVTEKGEEQEQ